jgi:hypothetical protein
MGNRSSELPPTLDEKTIDEISVKTGFTTDEVIRWHAEFLVSFLAHYGESVDFLIFFFNII